MECLYHVKSGPMKQLINGNAKTFGTVTVAQFYSFIPDFGKSRETLRIELHDYLALQKHSFSILIPALYCIFVLLHGCSILSEILTVHSDLNLPNKHCLG